MSIAIDSPAPSARSLINVTTAALRSDTYDIILYNASNTYRTIVSNTTAPAVITNVIPGTYAVLVLAGKSNSTAIDGRPAAILLGSGDVPFIPTYPTGALTGTGITTSGTSPTDGRGVTVAASGNTAVSVTLQNIVFTISSNALGTNPFSTAIGTSFNVQFQYDIFLNETNATGGSVGTAGGPLGLINFGLANFFGIATAAGVSPPDFRLGRVLRLWQFHPRCHVQRQLHGSG